MTLTRSVAFHGIAALVTLASCTHGEPTQRCSGVFDFQGIGEASARLDAYETILQFIELDRRVSLAGVEEMRIWISSTGDRCSRFANSFTQSESDIYRGLSYSEN